MTDVLDALATVIGAMSWTTYGGTAPDVSYGRIANQQGAPENHLYIEEDDSDTTTYQSFTGVIVKEIQYAIITGRFNTKAKRDNALADMIAEFPANGITILSHPTYREQNDYGFEMTIKRLG